LGGLRTPPGTLRKFLALALAAAWLAGVPSWLHAGTETISNAPPPGTDLTLDELRHLVLQRNEGLQARVLSVEAQRRRARGEYGVFEPDLYGTYTHQVNNRQNTAEEQASGLGQATFSETNNIYESGLQALVPIGTRFKLGYSLSDLNNSLQPTRGVTNAEYQSFFGVTLTQPVLKNFGTAVAMAGIRLAAISNKFAFQEYRRDLMALVSASEATYWNLYLAQEQVRFFEESLRTAETLLRDNRARLEAGKGSDLDVLEAQAGIGLRRAKLAEAQQKRLEAVNHLTSLYGQQAPIGELIVRAVDVPKLPDEVPNYEALQQSVLKLNPDFLMAEQRIEENRIRLGVARNQRLPEFDLKGSYGLNGLSSSPGSSWDVIEHGSFPSWYLGAELHIPLGGGIRSRNELAAARLELQASELGLRTQQNELLNNLNSSWRKLGRTRDSVGQYQAAVNYNLAMLDAALTRLEAGKLESRKVLEIDADLLESKVSVAESLVRAQLDLLELEMLGGSLLYERKLELSQADLQAASRKFGHSRAVGDTQYQQGLDAIEKARQQLQVEDPRFSHLPLR
jgi:outer membrane protein TolC